MSEAGAEIDRGRGFADATLLAGDCDDASHSPLCGGGLRAHLFEEGAAAAWAGRVSTGRAGRQARSSTWNISQRNTVVLLLSHELRHDVLAGSDAVDPGIVPSGLPAGILRALLLVSTAFREALPPRWTRCAASSSVGPRRSVARDTKPSYAPMRSSSGTMFSSRSLITSNTVNPKSCIALRTNSVLVLRDSTSVHCRPTPAIERGTAGNRAPEPKSDQRARAGFREASERGRSTRADGARRSAPRRAST